MHHRQDGLDLREIPSPLFEFAKAFGGLTLTPSWARAGVRFALFLLMTALLVPVYLALYRPSPRGRQAIVRLWFKGACRLTGLRVYSTGTPCREGATLMVSNHVSYLDIPVLGSLVDVVFVAKREVATWPLFGPLARLVRTVFIGRKPTEAARQAGDLSGRLKAGQNLLIFPEGTSTDGLAVRPFKSALFAVAEVMPEGAPLMVQPVSIAYPRTTGGRALSGGLQDFYAWHGDMTLLPHLLTVFGLKGAEVEVTFHKPVPATAFADRKDLARYCRTEVALGLSMATGRWRAAFPGGLAVPTPPLVDEEMEAVLEGSEAAAA